MVAIPGGGFYVWDRTACVVRRVDAAGIISTVAGNGTCGYTGDGGPAVDAELADVYSMAVDAAGNLWVDAGRTGPPLFLRRIGTDGTITSPDVGQTDPLGETNDITSVTASPDGTVYFTERAPLGVTPSSDFTLESIAADGTVTSLVTFSAPSGSPTGLAYISDNEFAWTGPLTIDHVYRLTVDSGSVASTGVTTRSAWAALVAASPDGTIYAPSATGNGVVRIAPDNSTTSIAGTGAADPATGAQSGAATSLALTPQGFALTPNDGLLISSGHVVYRIDQPATAG